MPHERLQEFVAIDFTRGDGHSCRHSKRGEGSDRWGRTVSGSTRTIHTAEVGFAVRDDHQNKGIGTELLSYLTFWRKSRGSLVSMQKYWPKTGPCSISLRRWDSISRRGERKGSTSWRWRSDEPSFTPLQTGEVSPSLARRG